jgi:hypothetical protein
LADNEETRRYEKTIQSEPGLVIGCEKLQREFLLGHHGGCTDEGV